MKVKIGVLSKSEHFVALAEELSRELEEQFEIRVKKTTSEKVPEDTRVMEEQGVEIILARGMFSAEEIMKVSTVPVVKCRLSMLDLTKNLKDVNPNLRCLISGQMFFPATFPEICREIEEIKGIKLEIFYYQNMEEMQQVLKRAQNNNIDFVLGGHIIHAEAQKIGLHSRELLFSKQTLHEYVHNARKIIMENRKIKKESKWVKSALEFTKQGVIAIDGHGLISNLNKKAEILLSASEDGLLGQSIFSCLPTLRSLIEEREPSQDNIMLINKQKVVLDIMPLYMTREYMGALISLENARDIQKLEQKIRKTMTEKGLVAKFTLEDIIGSSPLIQWTKKMAETLAKNEFNVLISGETGTGKELFAQGIHLRSLRNSGPFVAVNCAALPQNLLENELFGHEEGAFTGARKGGKIGLFELAHQGTIFLDEINTVSLPIQARLLRAIEEKEILRIGGDKIIPVDIRVIVATNEDLSKVVASGRFRKDLYYRINELNLTVPPLRKRKEDIPELVRFFLKDFDAGIKIDLPRAEAYIENIIRGNFSDYHWPGNVRELSNLVKRCLALLETAGEPEALLSFFSEDVFTEPGEGAETISVRKGTLAEMERELINTMFQKYAYNKSELAQKLNISRSTLWRILKD